MAYTALRCRGAAGYDTAAADLAGAAGRFLRERCEEARFDATKAAREAAEGVYLGRSLRDGQIPYNMQMDIDRLCLETAAERFLASGAAEDAFDVYFCFLEMFAGNYRTSRSMVELLSEFENNGSALLMKHRDHYSHSVYVFLLGLAIYETSARFRAVYEEFYGGLAPDAAARHFLEFWGLTALFHDVGYPFELPFEQVCSYFEVGGLPRAGMPYLAYRALEDYTRLPESLSPALAALYGPDEAARLQSTEDLFALHLTGRLGAVYGFTRESLRETLERKPAHPESFSHFMDHAWFSAALLFRSLYCAPGRALTEADMDAVSAILLHNSLYKFSVAHYKDPGNRPFQMELHPLAWLLMLCDELQCWDRTAYGRNSRSELHPMDCRFRFENGAVAATYIFDAQQQPKLEEYERRAAAWRSAKPQGDDPAALKQWKKSKPRLKACSDMLPAPDGGRSDFLRDIDSIVDTAPLGLTADIAWEPRQQAKKHSYLSDSSFLHLYCFAVCLNGRWMLRDAWADAKARGEERDFLLRHTAEFEAAFAGLSLEYKLSNINQAKAFDNYLNAIGCFYTDRPVDYPFLERFTAADQARIGPMEHERWLREHLEMGWRYGQPADGGERERERIHPDMIPEDMLEQGALTAGAAARHYAALSGTEQAKDVEAMNAMLTLLQIYDGVRIYRYREEETKP